MTILLYGTAVLTLASGLLTLVVWLLLRVCGRGRRFGRRALLVNLVLVPAHAVLVMPAFMGWFAVRNAHTRGDEAAYAGPRLAADGTWQLQSRESLLREEGDASAAQSRPASPFEVRLRAEDGVRLRAFLVPPLGAQRAPSVVIAHGLFRGALEIEPLGAMFRELGCEVLLLELRSHGQSDRAPFGFGWFEQRDVRAAVAFLRARPGRAQERVLLFGVSLGASAVLLAAPHVANLAALAVEAPMDDALATGQRMLNLPPKEGRRRLALPEPFRTLTLHAAQLWAGLDLRQVRPLEVVRGLPADLPALVVGGGDDLRMPPEVVRAVYDAMPMPEGTKRLWIRDGSDHGSVFVDDPAGYRERLRWLVESAREREAKR